MHEGEGRMRAGAVLILATALAGCGAAQSVSDFVVGGIGVGPNRVRTDVTVPYAAVLVADREDRRAFVVTTREVAVPLADLRESIRYPATRYCIKTFGASDADWTIDAATGDWASSLQDDQRVFSGRCTAR